MKLLADRLVLRYGKENAKKILLHAQDNVWGYHGLAWELGKRDFTFFNKYFLHDVFTGEGKSELADVHYDMWNTIQDMYTEDTHDRHAFLLPRGTGKSLTGSLPLAIWANLYGYSKYTVVASAVNDTAISFIRNIRNALIDNDRIERAFGTVYDSSLANTTDRIELGNETMIQALSSRSSFRGKSYLGNRISLLILDDFQSEENVSSREQMEKHWKRFSDDSANAIQKDNYKMIAMGTIIKPGDFYDRLRVTPTWKYTINSAVLVDDVDKHFNTNEWKQFKNILYNMKDKNRLDNAKEFYYEHKEDMQYPLLWQDYWDCLDIALQYYENPVSFKQEMQLRFDESDVSKFTNIVYTQDVTPGEILVIDPATSSKEDSDYTAWVVGGLNEEIIEIEYMDIDRIEFEQYISKTLDILKMFKSVNTVIIEKQTYNGSDVIALKSAIERDSELNHRYIEFINNHQTKNKDNKIDSIVGDVNLGRVRFNRALEHSPSIYQLKDFKNTTTSKHDDVPDALSELVLHIKESGLNNNRPTFYDSRFLF